MPGWTSSLHMHTHTYICTCTHKHTHTYMHMHTCTHTQRERHTPHRHRKQIHGRCWQGAFHVIIPRSQLLPPPDSSPCSGWLPSLTMQWETGWRRSVALAATENGWYKKIITLWPSWPKGSQEVGCPGGHGAHVGIIVSSRRYLDPSQRLP